MRYTVHIERDGWTGIERDAVSGVAEDDIEAVKEAARFTTDVGVSITFRVTQD